MHVGQMAMLPYVICTLASLGTAVIFVLAFVGRLRPWTILVGALAFLLLSVGFSLIAISAGPDPAFHRVVAADAIRWLFLAGGAIWIAWLVLFVAGMVRVRH